MKYIVHYESIVQEKFIDEIEADSLEEAEEIAQAFCDEGDTSDFELDCVIGGGDKDGHPSIYSIVKEGDDEEVGRVGRYANRIVHYYPDATDELQTTITIPDSEYEEFKAFRSGPRRAAAQ